MTSSPTYKITKIQAQKKRKERVNIYLDGEYAFPLNLESVFKHNLNKDTTLTDQELENLLVESEKEKLIAKLLNYISYRPRSKKEISDRLYKYTRDYKQKSETLISETLKYLEKNGLINDIDFAKWYVSQRQAHRPRSRQHLISELYKKGIDREIIDKVIQDSGFDESAQIQKLVEKHKNRKSPQKLKEYLLRKGFKYAEIIKVLAD